MFLVAAFVGFAIVGLALMVDPPAPSQAVAPAAASPRAADAGRQPAPATAETTDLTRDGWIGATQPRWARDGSRTISFKLEAEHDVAVWMKRVRPSLAVRCLSRKTEVFVITDSPASVEPTDRHTVHLSFDEGPDVEQTWENSADSQALFAPDGIALTRQIARARMLRFGFKPYNASPVVVEFDVRGFDQLIGLVAKTCGWKS